MERGDLRAAVADLTEAIDLCVAHGVLVAWSFTVGALAHALLEQGDADEAARVIDQGDFPEQLPVNQVHTMWFRLSRGRVRIETGSPSGESRSCSRLARPLGWSRSTIQATIRGAAGPPKAFDVSTGTTKRARSPARSSRSLDGGVTRVPSAPPCACSVWLKATRRESGCSGRRSRR